MPALPQLTTLRKPAHSCDFCSRLVLDFPEGLVRLTNDPAAIDTQLSSEGDKESEVIMEQVESAKKAGCLFASWLWPKLCLKRDPLSFQNALHCRFTRDSSSLWLSTEPQDHGYYSATNNSLAASLGSSNAVTTFINSITSHPNQVQILTVVAEQGRSGS
jgi:hypothetical protein